jgi:hypothetical protein
MPPTGIRCRLTAVNTEKGSLHNQIKREYHFWRFGLDSKLVNEWIEMLASGLYYRVTSWTSPWGYRLILESMTFMTAENVLCFSHPFSLPSLS